MRTNTNEKYVFDKKDRDFIFSFLELALRTGFEGCVEDIVKSLKKSVESEDHPAYRPERWDFLNHKDHYDYLLFGEMFWSFLVIHYGEYYQCGRIRALPLRSIYVYNGVIYRTEAKEILNIIQEYIDKYANFLCSENNE